MEYNTKEKPYSTKSHHLSYKRKNEIKLTKLTFSFVFSFILPLITLSSLLLIPSLSIPPNNTPKQPPIDIQNNATQKFHLPPSYIKSPPHPQELLQADEYFPILNELSENNVYRSLVIQKLEDMNTLSRSPSFLATFLAIESLTLLGQTLPPEVSEQITQYILSHFDPKDLHFKEPIPLVFYSDAFSISTYLDHPFDPLTSHWIAIMILSDIGKLYSSFNTSTIQQWINEIWLHQNPDGGFGTRFSPNSTLFETYIAVSTLRKIYNNSLLAFPPLEGIEIQNFVYSKQRTEEWAPSFLGAFSEYNPDTYLGWDNFFASWLAAEILSTIGGDPSPVASAFFTFVQNNALYLSEVGTYIGRWNEKYAYPLQAQYYGSALILETIRALGGLDVSLFPEYPTANENLLNAIISLPYSETSTFTFFRRNSYSTIPDLMTQYLSLQYLNKTNQISLLNSTTTQGITTYLYSLFEGQTGATYYDPSIETMEGLYSELTLAKKTYRATSPPINQTLILNKIIQSSIEGNHFSPFINTTYTDFDTTYFFFNIWSENRYSPLKATFMATQLMDAYTLLDEFYNEVGLSILDYEAYPATLLNPAGFFENGTNDNGNIQSTYYALQIQNTFMKITYSGFERYYNDSQIQSIITYVKNLVYENESLWFIDPSHNASNSQLSPYQATYYGVVILSLLNSPLTSLQKEKLATFLNKGLELFQNTSLSIEDLSYIIQTTKFLSLPINISTDLLFKISTTIQEIYRSLSESSSFRPSLLTALITFEASSQLQTFYSNSPLIIGSSSTLSLYFLSLTSLETVESLTLQGEDNEYSSWTIDQNVYRSQIKPEFNASMPGSWNPLLTFYWNNLPFSYTFHFSVSYSALPAFKDTLSLPEEEFYNISIQINASDDLLNALSLSLSFYFNNSLVYSLSQTNASYTIVRQLASWTYLFSISKYPFLPYVSYSEEDSTYKENVIVKLAYNIPGITEIYSNITITFSSSLVLKWNPLLLENTELEDENSSSETNSSQHPSSNPSSTEENTPENSNSPTDSQDTNPLSQQDSDSQEDILIWSGKILSILGTTSGFSLFFNNLRKKKQTLLKS